MSNLRVMCLLLAAFLLPRVGSASEPPADSSAWAARVVERLDTMEDDAMRMTLASALASSLADVADADALRAFKDQTAALARREINNPAAQHYLATTRQEWATVQANVGDPTAVRRLLPRVPAWSHPEILLDLAFRLASNGDGAGLRDVTTRLRSLHDGGEAWVDPADLAAVYDAAGDADAAEALVADGEAWQRADALGMRAEWRVLLGDREAASDLIARALATLDLADQEPADPEAEDAADTSDPGDWARATAVRVLARLGRLDEAQAAWDSVAEPGDFFDSYIYLAAARAAAGEEDAFERLQAELEKHADAEVDEWSLGYFSAATAHGRADGWLTLDTGDLDSDWAYFVSGLLDGLWMSNTD